MANIGLLELINLHTFRGNAVREDDGLSSSTTTRRGKDGDEEGIAVTTTAATTTKTKTKKGGGDSSSVITESGDEYENDRSVVMLCNYKMLEVAVENCSDKLFVTFSGTSSSNMRAVMPELYNTLWDIAIEAKNIKLDCVVIMGVDGLKDKTDFLRENKVDVVFNAGTAIDSGAMKPSDAPKGTLVRNLQEELLEEVNGERYMVWDNPREEIPVYRNVAMGGTFDHFHNGHKKMLTIAMSVCSKKLLVGVTSDEMLQTKKFKEEIEPLAQRKLHVEQFVALHRDDLALELPTISDLWGPTIVDPDLDAIVVSSETLKGARLINEQRIKKGMKRLDVIVVMRSNVHTLSSTFIRRTMSNQANDAGKL